MSRRIKRQWSFREADHLLKENGYKRVRSNGDHFIYVSAKGNAVSIPHSPNAMMMRRLIKENGLLKREREMKL